MIIHYELHEVCTHFYSCLIINKLLTICSER